MTVAHYFIERLHLHDPGGNPVALKLGLKQALRQMRLPSAHLPPQAILVIRHLQNRSPFGLKAAQMIAWQQQMQAQIEELARRALRPGRQHIPPHAASVLFADDVELLLCYTRDLLVRRTAWYWAQLFPTAAYPSQPAGQRLVTGWATYVQAIPHVLVDLTPREVQLALNTLTSTQHAQLAHLLHDTFALPDDVFAAVIPDDLKATSSLQTAPSADHPGFDAQLHFSVPTPSNSQEAFANQMAAPWHTWLPPHHYQYLPPQAAYILGLSYTLVHRPQQARQRRFAQQAKQWLETTIFQLQTSTVQTNPIKKAPATSLSKRPLPSPSSPTSNLHQSHQQSEALKQSRSTKFLAAEGSFTQLGGAIFLINLLTYLQLPTAVPALNALNPWELLGGLAVDLLGDRFSQYQNDPLWPIINELAGLETQARWGQNLADPVSFQLPPAWLVSIATATLICRLEKCNGRLRVWDTATTILIADLPDNLDGLDNLVNIYQKAGIALSLKPEAGWTVLPNGANQHIAPHLTWVVVRLRPYLTHYLHYLSGEAYPTMLSQPATLTFSRTHVDIQMSLEQIDVSLRRAGLDRTPGWLPEFGYIITIHFE